MSYRQSLGRWGEGVAAEYLSQRGYEILERNFRTPYGEIDLVTRHEGAIIFVEVKTRASKAFGRPEESVTEQKQAHLLDAAEAYLQTIPEFVDDWRVDVLAVALHWGGEYVSLPQTSPGIAEDDPVEIAHLALDAGADIIIGNHPHWVQAVELYEGKFIAYAHGNFIFDQMWSYETRVGVIGRYTFYDDVLVGVEFIPTLIENYAQPVPMEGAEAQAVLDGMKAASEELAGRLAGAPTAP